MCFSCCVFHCFRSPFPGLVYQWQYFFYKIVQRLKGKHLRNPKGCNTNKRLQGKRNQFPRNQHVEQKGRYTCRRLIRLILY